MTAQPQAGPAHCVHHNVHFEFCHDYADRLAHIAQHKPAAAQETSKVNLWLFPKEFKASAAHDKASAAYVRARATCVETLRDAMPAIQVEHDRLVREEGYVCTWSGTSIFTEEEKETS